MPHLQLTLPRRHPEATTFVATARQLASFLLTVHALARTGGQSLMTSLHRSRSREAARVLRQYPAEMANARAHRSGASIS